MGKVLIGKTQIAAPRTAATYCIYFCMDTKFISIINNPAVVTCNRSEMAGRVSFSGLKQTSNKSELEWNVLLS
jgi:hypothetical protein